VLKDLAAAEKWIRAASNDIRNERFAPIADQAQGVWDMLRMQSSVLLKKIVLTGAGSARKVVLDVSVDGMEGAALGVMSQGELNSLALSLFMPRATLPESPFRFVVIDDPVQSMDPARVDGLARMLEQAARTRQVIVFTHDERLARSCRLLGIDAKVVEVTRRPESVVELRPGQDPGQPLLQRRVGGGQERGPGPRGEGSYRGGVLPPCDGGRMHRGGHAAKARQRRGLRVDRDAARFRDRPRGS
jgi:hypothetical protein